jgi:uncharacterized protein (TIGR03032 family)
MAEAQQTLDITAPLAFNRWLSEQRASLAFTTYQTGTLFALGLDGEDRIAVDSIHLKRCMGLWANASGRSLWVAARDQIWRFNNILPPGGGWEGYDAIYAPQASWTTGDLDVHDLARDAKDRLVFVNTRYNCLSIASESHHFSPLWQPSFISGMEAGDRCHLNGLALRNGKVAHVSALAQTDVPQGWRGVKRDSGVVIDPATGETVAGGLSMPHSPRWAEGRLWLLESGTGSFGYVDLARGRFEPILFCPGYPRGLAFHNQYALIGLSLPREQSGFASLPLDEALERRGIAPCCGLMVVDVRRAKPLCLVRIEGVVQELYDVAVLPGVRKPRWIGLDSEDLHYLLGIGPRQPL